MRREKKICTVAEFRNQSFPQISSIPHHPSCRVANRVGDRAGKDKINRKWKDLLQNTAAQQCSSRTHIFNMLQLRSGSSGKKTDIVFKLHSCSDLSFATNLTLRHGDLASGMHYRMGSEVKYASSKESGRLKHKTTKATSKCVKKFYRNKVVARTAMRAHTRCKQQNEASLNACWMTTSTCITPLPLTNLDKWLQTCS